MNLPAELSLRPHKKTYLIIFLIFKLLDIVSTISAISIFGLVETNPLAQTIPLGNLFLISMAVNFLIVIAISYIDIFPFWIIKLMIVLAAWPVINNIIQEILVIIKH
jgi:hypothetical protein